MPLPPLIPPVNPARDAALAARFAGDPVDGLLPLVLLLGVALLVQITRHRAER